MRNTSFIAFAFVAVILQAALGVLVAQNFAALHPFIPNLLLPLAIYLGVAPDVSMPRGALLSFVIGVVQDETSGSPVGIGTLILVVTCIVAHASGVRLFLRGRLFQLGLGFGAAFMTGAVVLAMCAIFEAPAPFPLRMPTDGPIGDALSSLVLRTSSGPEVPMIGAYVSVLATLVASALATGLVSPLVFFALRRLDVALSRGRRAGEEVAA